MISQRPTYCNIFDNIALWLKTLQRWWARGGCCPSWNPSWTTPLTSGMLLWSSRLLHLRCKKERVHRSFLLTAVRLFHADTTWPPSSRSSITHIVLCCVLHWFALLPLGPGCNFLISYLLFLLSFIMQTVCVFFLFFVFFKSFNTILYWCVWFGSFSVMHLLFTAAAVTSEFPRMRDQ